MNGVETLENNQRLGATPKIPSYLRNRSRRRRTKNKELFEAGALGVISSPLQGATLAQTDPGRFIRMGST